jgi:prepilin peptidase CpaA
MLLCFGFLVWATYTDLKAHKIYNVTTYTGIIVALFARGWFEGSSGFIEGLQGLGACVGIMIVCYALFHVGGGDVKLMAMIGTFLGLDRGVGVLLWTFVIGAVMALMIIVWQFGIINIVRGTVRHLWLMLTSMRWVRLSAAERQPLQYRLYLAPSALIGFLLICSQDGFTLW